MEEEQVDIQTGKEAYEAKKAEKEKNREKSAKVHLSQKKKKNIRGYVILFLIVALLGGGFYFLVKRELPEGEDFSQAIAVQGRSHIEIGSEHEAYSSNPPTSGSHYSEPARSGFRVDENIADEHIIHSLEHGLIWVSYNPEVSEEVVKGLKKLVTGLVVMTQREANDSDIALAAWGRLDTFDVGEILTDGDKQRIRDFIRRYVNRGPERLSPNQHRGL